MGVNKGSTADVRVEGSDVPPKVVRSPPLLLMVKYWIRF